MNVHRESPISQSAAPRSGETGQPERDSAYYSGSSSGDASKHTSVVSNAPSTFTSSPAAYQSDTKTPPPINTLSQPHISPTTSGPMSVTSMISPTTPSSAHMDRSMLDKLNNRTSTDPVSQRSSYVSSIGDGRRDSIDSRSINTGLDQMRLNGNSPYTSNHASSTSIQATLQNQRDPRNGQSERLSVSRFSSGYSGSSQHIDPAARHGRMAPAITGPSAPQFAHGAIPVQGQAWAGPFAEFEPRDEGSRNTSFIDSRRSSVAESYISNASQLTTESALPRGQRRLEEGYADSYTPRRERSEADLATTHHHQLKHKQIGELMDQEGGSPGSSSQPYSRTPELRVSHKLAERKRRDEMKQLYDTLRDLMPQERGSKASKWEILSKAIAEHRNQSNAIQQLSREKHRLEQELHAAHREIQFLKEERFRSDGAAGSARPMPPTPNYQHDPDRDLASRQQQLREPSHLPSIRSIEPPAPYGQEAMSGVQYSGGYTTVPGPAPPVPYRTDAAYGRA